MIHAKSYETVSTFVKVMQKNRGLFFPRTRCIYQGCRELTFALARLSCFYIYICFFITGCYRPTYRI